MTWREWLAHDRGGVAIMAAAGALLACLMTAIVVDGGSIALAARDAQSAADLAALAAARDLNRAGPAARATVTDNLSTTASLRTEVGLYTADPAVPPADRFQVRAASDAGLNAARVAVTHEAPLFFGRLLLGRDSYPITRQGTAAVRSEQASATLSIGSRLASLDGGVVNTVLSALTGSEVSLKLMDYRALADTKVNLLRFSDALATEVGVTAGDYERLVDQSIDAGDFLDVLESVSVGGTAALDALAEASRGRSIRIGEVLGLDTASAHAVRDGLDLDISALDLTNAVLQTGTGSRQVALDLTAEAGLAEVTAMLGIGERPNRSPWLTVTDRGEPVIRTAQMRLYLNVRTADALAGVGQLKVPLVVEIAAAEAKLAAISCDQGRRAEVDVRPGVARARLGAVERPEDLDDFTTALRVAPATLLKAPLVSVTASADLEAADTGFSRLRFTEPEIAGQIPKTRASTAFTSTVVSSLLSRTDIDIHAGPLSIGTGSLLQSVGQILSPLGSVLDRLANGVFASLGLSFGEADVVVHDLRCAKTALQPVLVG